MTREELLSIPKRDLFETLHDVRAVYIIPSDKVHDSGYACFDFVAVKGENLDEYIGFGSGCDAVKIIGNLNLGVDCEKDNHCVRLWSMRPFSVSPDASTIELY